MSWRLAVWTTLSLLAFPGVLPAQLRSSVPVFSMTPPEAEPEPEYSSLESGVSFIDSAMPRTTLRMRGDLEYDNRRPTRAEYVYSKRGYGLPERNVDRQELGTYLEFAVSPWLSFFADQPYRWVNPDFNPNRSGAGDIDLGMKFAFYDSSSLLATFQLRATAPIAVSSSLDSRHWALEPGLLVNYRLLDFLTLEGEGRYWFPLTDHPYAGDVVRYGVGVSYGQRSSSEIWLMPVAEAVGWTALGGLSEVVHPNAVEVQRANGQTIVNGNLGLRMGLGGNLEFYGGYSRPFTGNTWYRELYRLEFRLTY